MEKGLFKHIYLFSLFALSALLLTAAKPSEPIRALPFKTFGTGEQVTYRVHYGFINAGEALMQVDDNLQKVGSRGCYKIEIYGKTTGAFDKFLKIRNVWGTLLDTAQLVPHRSYRNIQEGNYRKAEEIAFDYYAKKALITDNGEKSELNIPGAVQDMVSGYYFLRMLDYDRLKEGQVIAINGFFEKTLYNFKVKYQGRKRIKTKYGRTTAILLTPIMPENKLFDGENSIQFYISDDKNRIPLKIRAELFVGAVELDITGYENLRYPAEFDKK